MPARLLFSWLIDQWGDWYNHDVYYRLRIHSRSHWQRIIFRAAYFPKALLMRIRSAINNSFELPRVEVAITTRCTLRCRDCSNLIIFYQQRKDIETARIIGDIQDLMASVDRIHRFIVMGGEPLLHTGLADILSYLLAHPGIGAVQLITNGTVVPGRDMLELLQHPRMMVTVSNYPAETAKKKTRVLSLLEEYDVNYVHEPDFQWVDLGGWAPPVDTAPNALEERFKTCPRKTCHNILDGQYHLCPRSAHGMKLGQIPQDEQYYVAFRNRSDPLMVRQDLRNLFRLKYINACTRCRGGEAPSIPPAIQLRPEEAAGGFDESTFIKACTGKELLR